MVEQAEAVADRLRAAGGQPVQLHGEEQDQQDREPERGDRDAEEANHGDDVVGERVLPYGGEDTDRQRDQQREQDRAAQQLDRARQPLPEDREHRALLQHGDAQVAAQPVPHQVEVLLIPGQIESQVVAQADDLLLAGALAQGELGGVAGSEVDHKEDDQRDADQQRNSLQQATDDVTAHTGDSAPIGYAVNRQLPGCEPTLSGRYPDFQSFQVSQYCHMAFGW